MVAHVLHGLIILYVTGFAKKSLPYTSKYMSWRPLIRCLSKIQTCNYPYFFIHVSTLCSANFKFRVLHISNYEMLKSVNLMCVEDPFLQIWSHNLFIYFFLSKSVLVVCKWSRLVYSLLLVICKSTVAGYITNC